jgi:hypothetical protein
MQGFVSYLVRERQLLAYPLCREARILRYFAAWVFLNISLCRCPPGSCAGAHPELESFKKNLPGPEFQVDFRASEVN